MKIVYFYRHSNSGFSIKKVFSTIVNEIGKNQDIEEFYIPCYRADPVSLLKNIFFVYKHRNKKAVNHITGDIHYCILALIGCKSVLTIHDLVFIKNSKNILDRFFKYLLWLYLPVKFATQVVCISENTKDDVLKLVKKKNITVIHNPVDSAFQYLEKEFNTECPVILHIGTGWNKNLLRVIEALADIPCQLRIIGKLNDEYIKLLNDYHINYSNTHSLTDDEMVTEYQKCDIVSFPSIYEGFGMPIIEGQATGRIVLTSDMMPMTEVGNNSVVYVNPENIKSVREGFWKIIKNSNLRNELLEKSKVNVNRFHTCIIIEKYKEVYSLL